MYDLSLTPGSLTFYLFVVFIFTFLVQQAFYWILFARLAFFKNNPLIPGKGGISVVICARNEHDHLKENLPFILAQDYPDFEVVVVNWASEDDSSFLLARMNEEFPNLKIVEIKENLNFFSGKKFPLSIGIKSAKNDMIVVTNADCRPVGRNWLSLMRSGFTASSEVVLGYGAYEKKEGFMNKLVRFDAAQIAFRYLSCALSGIPYMGVGRNMAYLKSLFFENKGFISHYRIASGDDDLFINKVAKRNNTKIVLHPDSLTLSEPPKLFRLWMIQKKRQLSTLRFYRSGHRLLFGLYSMSIFLFYLLFLVLLIMDYNTVLLLPLFITRLIAQIIIFYQCMTRLDERDLIWFVPFFEITMIFVYSMAFMSNLFSKRNKWK
jgi:glycosyltransferase involved in cell wall biosynthesis